MDAPRQKLDFALNIDFSGILTNPILDIAARVWEEDRYAAFKVCYRSMRRIDDLVDTRKSTGEPVTEAESRIIERMMLDWLRSLKRGERSDAYQTEFLETLDRFRIPLWPWERLSTAMIYDLHHNGFSSLNTFLRYTEGAAISPAAVFMHLCGIRQVGDRFVQPNFDIRIAARPLAIFSYLVHIMRDFEKDTKANLLYFADDLMVRHNLSRTDLEQIVTTGEPSPNFRALMREYVHFADYYRAKARLVLDGLRPELAPRYQASLELIYQLYLQIFERIDAANGLFSEEALRPDPAEVQARITNVLASFSHSTT